MRPNVKRSRVDADRRRFFEEEAVEGEDPWYDVEAVGVEASTATLVDGRLSRSANGIVGDTRARALSMHAVSLWIAGARADWL